MISWVAFLTFINGIVVVGGCIDGWMDRWMGMGDEVGWKSIGGVVVDCCCVFQDAIRLFILSSSRKRCVWIVAR